MCVFVFIVYSGLEGVRVPSHKRFLVAPMDSAHSIVCYTGCTCQIVSCSLRVKGLGFLR